MIRKNIVILLAFIWVQYSNGRERETFKNVKVSAFASQKPAFETTITANNLAGSIPSDASYDTLIISSDGIQSLEENSVSDLLDLYEIVLARNGIKHIKPGAFRNLPYLEKIDLSHNRIEDIEYGVFNGLQVGRLILSYNALKSIDSDAFDGLPKLNLIDLSHNRLEHWDSNWFKYSPDLTRVYMNHNRIHLLPISAFKNFESDKRLGEASFRLTLDFSDNRLEELDSRTFEDLTRIKDLWLDNNRIKTINADVFKWTMIETLRLNDNEIKCLPGENLSEILKAERTELDGNPWNCTCLEQVKDWVEKNENGAVMTYSTMQCELMRIDRKLTALEGRI